MGRNSRGAPLPSMSSRVRSDLWTVAVSMKTTGGAFSRGHRDGASQAVKRSGVPVPGKRNGETKGPSFTRAAIREVRSRFCPERRPSPFSLRGARPSRRPAYGSKPDSSAYTHTFPRRRSRSRRRRNRLRCRPSRSADPHGLFTRARPLPAGMAERGGIDAECAATLRPLCIRTR